MMRLRIAGLLLVALVAVSAVAAASASATGLPSVTTGKCEKLTTKTGWFTNSTCTTESATKVGEFEWEAVPGTIVGASTEKTVLETANGSTVKCEKATSTGGQAKGPQESTKTVVTFSECTESIFGGKCENDGKGHIVTNALKTKTGFVAGSKKTEVGLELTPETGTTFVTFSCLGGFAKIEVRGAVVGALGNGEHNKKQPSLKLVFEKGATAGSQKITEIEGGTKNAHLESSLNKGTFENSNQQGKGTISLEKEGKKVEFELKA